MTQYDKGRRFEYRVKKHYEEYGWTVFRTAGSHSQADLIAMRAGEVQLIQCRTNGYLLPIERIGFLEVAKELGVTPVLAYKEVGKLIIQVICAVGGVNLAIR